MMKTEPSTRAPKQSEANLLLCQIFQNMEISPRTHTHVCEICVLCRYLFFWNFLVFFPSLFVIFVLALILRTFTHWTFFGYNISLISNFMWNGIVLFFQTKSLTNSKYMVHNFWWVFIFDFRFFFFVSLSLVLTCNEF